MYKPKYKILADKFLDNIKSGYWREGSKIPTENELAIQYEVSRDTVRSALKELENAGFISRQAGVGTTVNYERADYSLVGLRGFSEQMRELGKVPSSQILSYRFESFSKPNLLAFFGIAPGEKLYELTRIRLADQEKMALETAYINPKLCPDILSKMHENVSLYDLYENEYKLTLGKSNINLVAEIPSQTVRDLLDIDEHTPVLTMDCYVKLKDGRPLYYVRCYYIGKRYTFSTVLEGKL
jgi:GntR family transcriptional regulator